MPLGIVEAVVSGKRSRNLQNLGIGLMGMRERLHQLGGELKIHSGAQGATVHVAVPLPASIPIVSGPILST
jgi:signal transduction histidine kinase